MLLPLLQVGRCTAVCETEGTHTHVTAGVDADDGKFRRAPLGCDLTSAAPRVLA